MDAAADLASLAAGAFAYEHHLEPNQERLLAEVIYTAHSSAPLLRFAVIPLARADLGAVGSAVRSSRRRAQQYLWRATARFATRGDHATLRSALLALAGADVPSELAAEIAVSIALAERCPAAALRAALRVDRVMSPALVAPAALSQFRALLETVLRELGVLFPPTPLEAVGFEQCRKNVRDYFIRANLSLAMTRAHVVRRRSAVALEDLFEMGCVGLIQAVDNFDARYGRPFAAYAYPWVKQAIRRGERKSHISALPERVDGIRRRVLAALSDPDRTCTTASEFAAELGVTAQTVVHALRGRPALSLDDDETRALIETCEDQALEPLDESVHAGERRRAVERALSAIEPRGRDIIRRAFGIGCSPEPVAAIAKAHGLTPQRVYQIRDAEIRHLRHPRVARDLLRFL